jgi:hypothetical protein
VIHLRWPTTPPAGGVVVCGPRCSLDAACGIIMWR